VVRIVTNRCLSPPKITCKLFKSFPENFQEIVSRMKQVNNNWTAAKKITFRFFFLLLGLTSALCWISTIYLTFFFLIHHVYNPAAVFKLLAPLFYWLDSNIYHTGYNPTIHRAFPQDNHFAEVFYLTALYVSVLGAALWSLLDAKRPNYNRLFYWFTLYIRYILGIVAIIYGIDKLIPVQMPHPDVVNLATPVGDLSRFQVLWDFMGISPGYMMMVGAGEVLGGLCLLFRRTFLFGSLLLLVILANVVAVNFFYNVPIKTYSTQLLVYAIFLIVPFAPKLYNIFFTGISTSVLPEQYTLNTRLKRNLLKALLIAIPSILIIPVIIGYHKRLIRQTENARGQRIYNVITFVAKDTLPPLTTDTLRWNRLMLFVHRRYAVIFSMQNQPQQFECSIDKIKKTFIFRNGPDSAKWNVFNYSYPAKNRMELTGKWKGQNINVLMEQSPVGSIPLNREKIILLNDD